LPPSGSAVNGITCEKELKFTNKMKSKEMMDSFIID